MMALLSPTLAFAQARPEAIEDKPSVQERVSDKLSPDSRPAGPKDAPPPMSRSDNAPKASTKPSSSRTVTPIEGLPPSVEGTEPKMITPGEAPSMQVPPPPEKAPPPAAEQPALLDPVKMLREQQVYSEAMSDVDTPITRAELADVLVKAMMYNTKMYSEFPFYRDVDRDHWAYVPIEVAREKRLLVYPDDGGFYYPKQVITFSDVYRALANAITGAPPEPERADYLLRNIPDRTAIPADIKPSVAKLAKARFFTRVNRYETTYEPPEKVVTVGGLAPLVNFLIFVNLRRAPIAGAAETETLAMLPSGMNLMLTPATGVLEAQMTAGKKVYFYLTQAVDSLPHRTVLIGVVREALPNRAYKLEFTEVRTPGGERFGTFAELMIKFEASDKLGFIVPGEVFEVETKRPPAPLTEIGLPSDKKDAEPSTSQPPPSFRPGEAAPPQPTAPKIEPVTTPPASTAPATKQPAK